MSAPPTSRPTGWRPSEIVRAVLPIRPSRSSGEYAVRSVMYVTSTIDWATPGTNAAATCTGIADRDRERRPARRRSRCCRRAGSRRRGRARSGAPSSSDPRTVPTPYAARIRPRTDAGSPRSRVTWTARAVTSGASRIDVAPQNRIDRPEGRVGGDEVDALADLGQERGAGPVDRRAQVAPDEDQTRADSANESGVDRQGRAGADRRRQDAGDGRTDDVARRVDRFEVSSWPGRPGCARREPAPTPCSRRGRTSGGCSSAPRRAG